jgi:hypothetical protein
LGGMVDFGLVLATLKVCMVSHEKEGNRRMGAAHLKYVADNEQTRRGKVL